MTKTITYTYPAPHEIPVAPPQALGTDPASPQLRYPTSDEATTGTWTMTGGGDYHSCLDEAVLNTADYITCTAVGRQTFGFTAYAIPAGCTITSVVVVMCTVRHGANVGRMGGELKVGGNYYGGLGHTPYESPEWGYFTRSWATNPKSGAAWTLNDVNGIGVNALQAFGVYSDDCTPTVSCAQCWLQVYFTPGVAPLMISTGNIATDDMPTTNYGEMRFVLWAWIVVQMPNDMGAQASVGIQPDKWLGYLKHDWTTMLHDADGDYLTLSVAIPWFEPVAGGAIFRLWANRAGVNLVYWAWGIYCTRYNPYGCLDSKTVDLTVHFDYDLPFAEPNMVSDGGNLSEFLVYSGGVWVPPVLYHIPGDPWQSEPFVGVNLQDEVWLGKAYLSDDLAGAEDLPWMRQCYMYSIWHATDYRYRMDTVITQVDLPDDTGGCSGEPIAVWGSWRGCSTGGFVTLWRHTNFARKVGGLWDVQILDATSSYGGWVFSRGDEVAVFSRTAGVACVWRSTDRGATWALSADVWPIALIIDMIYVPISDTIVAVYDTGVDPTAWYSTCRSTDFGATWDAPVDILNSDDDLFWESMHAQLCHDESGNIHIAMFSNTDLRLINHWHSHDLGLTWTKNPAVLDANALPFPGSWEGYPLVFAEGGKVLVAYEMSGNIPATDWGGTYIMYTVSTDGGHTFSAQAWATMPDRCDDSDGLFAQMSGGEVYLYYIGWYDDDPTDWWGHYPQDDYYATFYVKSTGWGVGAPVFTDPGGGEVLHAGILDSPYAVYRIDPNTQLSADMVFEPQSWYLQYTDPRGPWGWWNWSGHIYEMNPTDWGPLVKTYDPGWRSGGTPDCALPEYYEWTVGEASMWLMGPSAPPIPGPPIEVPCIPFYHQFNANQANLFIQPNGPNTAPIPLGCHDLADITVPQGDIYERFCLKQDGSGELVRVIKQGQLPGRVTTSLTTYVKSLSDALEQLQCAFPLYVQFAYAGRKDLFNNYDRGALLNPCTITNATTTSPANRQEVASVEQTFDIDAGQFDQYFRLQTYRRSCAETRAITDISFITTANCLGACGPTEDGGTIGALCASAAVASQSNIYYTLNAGATWNLCAGHPFAVNENINCIECFNASRDITRLLVARSTTDAANPLEVAYSDNYGATWNTRDVGATVGEYAPYNGSLYIYNGAVWLLTSLGRLYKSYDYGVNWDAGRILAVVPLNVIRFTDPYYGLLAGTTGRIMATRDGGFAWSIIAPPAGDAANEITSVQMLDRTRWWIGFANGHLYYTVDSGVTWTQRLLPIPYTLSSVDRISGIHFLNECIGFVAARTRDALGNVFGTLYRTINGGFSWETYTTDSMAAGSLGYIALSAIDPNICHVAGGVSGALGVINTITT